MNKSLFLLIFCLLSSCVQRIEKLPMAASANISVTPLVSAKGVGPMDISPDGRFVVWGDSGLNLHQIAEQKHNRLLAMPPEMLSISPDGTLFSVIVSKNENSTLYVFNSEGFPVFEQTFSGRVGRIQWLSNGELIIGLLEVKIYSFGSNLKGKLLRFNRDWGLRAASLFETTINPLLSKELAGKLPQTFDFDISASGDEVLYSRLYSPPAFPPARHLMLQNLQTHKETRIAVLPLLAGKARLTIDGESAFITAGAGQVEKQALWGTDTGGHWPADDFDYDVSSGLLLTENQLLRENDSLLSLPPESQGKLSWGGHFLLVSWENQLYLLTGYPVDPARMLTNFTLNKLRKLRRLRSRGLIDQNEYFQARERLLP